MSWMERSTCLSLFFERSQVDHPSCFIWHCKFVYFLLHNSTCDISRTGFNFMEGMWFLRCDFLAHGKGEPTVCFSFCCGSPTVFFFAAVVVAGGETNSWFPCNQTKRFVVSLKQAGNRRNNAWCEQSACEKKPRAHWSLVDTKGLCWSWEPMQMVFQFSFWKAMIWQCGIDQGGLR